MRIGVGKPPHKDRGADHVLDRVPAAQRELLDSVVAEAADAVETIVADGIECRDATVPCQALTSALTSTLAS